MGLIPSAFLLVSLSVWVLTCVYLNTFPTALEGDRLCAHIPFWWFCGITRIPCISLRWEQCQPALLVVRSLVPTNTLMRGWSIPCRHRVAHVKSTILQFPRWAGCCQSSSALRQLWRAVKPFNSWSLCREMCWFYRTAITSFLFL